MATLQEFDTASMRLSLPCPRGYTQHFMYLSITCRAPPHLKPSVLLVTPASRAMEVVISLNVEPGSYTSLKQKLLQRLFQYETFSSSVIAANASSSPGIGARGSLGSNSSDCAMAST